MNETLHKFRSRVGRHPAAQLRLGCGVNENCPVMDIIFTFLRYVDSTWSRGRGKEEKKSHFSVSVCGLFWVLYVRGIGADSTLPVRIHGESLKSPHYNNTTSPIHSFRRDNPPALVRMLCGC